MKATRERPAAGVHALRTKPSPGVHALRTKPAFDMELEWFFNRAECDMGLRSTFEATLGARCPRPGAPTPEETVEAARAYRTIRRWLLAIDDRDAGVLQAAYEVRPWPLHLYDELGRLTGVVVRLACALGTWPEDRRAQQAMEMARAEVLAAECFQCRGTSFSPIVRLRREAEKRFARASHAYAVVRGKGPCAVRAS
jgi:hypothetical protein